MDKTLIFLLLTVSSYKSFSQRIEVPQLLNMLSWTSKQIDTTLKKDGYLLMKKDVEETTALYQYSWFDRPQDKQAEVRSLNYMDVTVRNMQSRLITYRTYDKEEYQDISAWLLANNYHATAQFDFKESKHTLYGNGQQTIRVKVITTALKDGKTYIAYELELGK